MVGILLRFINAPGIILINIFGVAVQTSLFTSWPLTLVQPDITLLIVVWSALRRPFIEGGILTLIVANIAEIHSASTQGLVMVSSMVVYLSVRMANRILVIPDLASYVIVTLFASILWKLSSLAMLYGLGGANNHWRHSLLFLFPGALVEGALGYWFYRWLERYDWLTHKKAPAEQAVLGDPDQVGTGDYAPGYDEEMQMEGFESWSSRQRPWEERRLGSRGPTRGALRS